MYYFLQIMKDEKSHPQLKDEYMSVFRTGFVLQFSVMAGSTRQKTGMSS